MSIVYRQPWWPMIWRYFTTLTEAVSALCGLVSWWTQHPVLLQHCFTKDGALQLASCNEWNWNLLCWALYALCCLSETLSIYSASQIICRKLSYLVHVIGVVISNHLPSKHNSVRKFNEIWGYDFYIIKAFSFFSMESRKMKMRWQEVVWELYCPI